MGITSAEGMMSGPPADFELSGPAEISSMQSSDLPGSPRLMGRGEGPREY